MTDQRKYPRFEIPLSADVANEVSGEHVKATVTDFSRGGMGLVLDHAPFSSGQAVQLQLFLNIEQYPVKSTGTVMWHDQARSKQQVGIRFDDIDPESKSDILDLAYEQWRKKALQSK